MTAYARNMPHTATYWAPGVPDGFGGMDFSSVTPVVIACRWQDRQELFRDTQGNQVMSVAIVYPAQAVALQGYLARGDAGTAVIGDPREAGALEVRAVGSSPSLSGDEELNKAWL